MQIATRPGFWADPTASPSKTRNIDPKHSSKLSSENFGAARDQTSASDLEDWRYTSSRFCAGRFRELDSKEITMGSSGTRFKSGINQALRANPAFELLDLEPKDKSMLCRSTQNRRSKTGFDSLGSSMRINNEGKARNSRRTCSVFQKTRQTPFKDNFCFSRDMERCFTPGSTRDVNF